jgi:hypothetical protein
MKARLLEVADDGGGVEQGRERIDAQGWIVAVVRVQLRVDAVPAFLDQALDQANAGGKAGDGVQRQQRAQQEHGHAQVA